jgi:hypothetical protein
VRAVQAVATLALLLLAAGAFARWVRDRASLAPESGAGTAADAPGAPPAAWLEGAPRTAWADLYLDRGVAFGPMRPVEFGCSDALFSVGHSPDGPDVVFPRLRLRLRVDPPDLASAPSPLRATFRSNAVVGRFEGGASFVHLPLDLGGSPDVLRTERGAALLALRAEAGWRYLLFLFPNGLQLSAGGRLEAVEPSVAELGSRVSRVIEPLRRIPFGALPAASGCQMTLCRWRASGPSRMTDLRRELAREGWRSPLDERLEDAGRVAVLERDGRRAWIVENEEEAADTVLVMVWDS